MSMVYLLARRSRFPLAGTLSWPAGSAHEPWGCAAGAGTDAPLAAAIASPLLAAATGLFGLRVVLSKVGKHGRLPTRLYGIFARLGWPIQSAV